MWRGGGERGRIGMVKKEKCPSCEERNKRKNRGREVRREEEKALSRKVLVTKRGIRGKRDKGKDNEGETVC